MTPAVYLAHLLCCIATLWPINLDLDHLQDKTAALIRGAQQWKPSPASQTG